MSKIGMYQPADKQKNYLLPTSKQSHSFHEEKEKPLENIIYKKLKKVAELLEALFYNLSDDYDNNFKASVGQNLKLLIQDLEIMHNSLKKPPSAGKQSSNLHCIHEMQGACESLQKTSPREIEIKELAKIKHALHELDTLLMSQDAEVKVENKKEAPVKKAVPKKVITKKKKEKL